MTGDFDESSSWMVDRVVCCDGSAITTVTGNFSSLHVALPVDLDSSRCVEVVIIGNWPVLDAVTPKGFVMKAFVALIPDEPGRRFPALLSFPIGGAF